MKLAMAFTIETSPKVRDHNLRTFQQTNLFAVERADVLEIRKTFHEDIDEPRSGLISRFDQMKWPRVEIISEDCACFAKDRDAFRQQGDGFSRAGAEDVCYE